MLRVNLYLNHNLYTSIEESRNVNQTKHIHTCIISVYQRQMRILRVNLYLNLYLYTSIEESRNVNQTKYKHTCSIYVTNRDVYNKFIIG